MRCITPPCFAISPKPPTKIKNTANDYLIADNIHLLKKFVSFLIII